MGQTRSDSFLGACRNLAGEAISQLIMKQYYVYIMTKKPNNVLYSGITGDLLERVHQHKSMKIDGFTKKYYATKLVYYEAYDDPAPAILREK